MRGKITNRSSEYVTRAKLASSSQDFPHREKLSKAGKLTANQGNHEETVDDNWYVTRKKKK